MTAALQRRFTVDEYHRMAEAGVLHEDDRVELLDGHIVTMLPIGSSHGGSVNRLLRIFERASRDRWVTMIQNPVDLDAYSEPEPDVALLRPRDDLYESSHPKPADVFLLIEVADSSLLTDREEKLPLYARAAIPEVWIVNLPQRIIEVYSAPANGRYSKTRQVLPGQSLAPAAFPDTPIDTAALLRSQN